MSYTFRPAIRENTPLIVGLSGPTKSGKTFSALRLAVGMANGGTIAMINAEGPRGHQYADRFKYVTCDIQAPYRPTVYTEALQVASDLNPSVIIIDSASHMHDGPGGILEWHEELMDEMSGGDKGKRERVTYTAWVKPKAAENAFIYQMLGMKCPVILALRAKEKIKIVPGKAPIDLGWQPIVGERVTFETIFTLTLTPHCKGVPDLSISDMREPFDTMFPVGQQLDEKAGELLAQWAAGGQADTPQSRKDAINEAKGIIKGLMGEMLNEKPSHQDADLDILKADFERDLKQANGFKEAAAVRDKALSSNLPTAWKDGFKLKFQDKFRQAT